MRRTCFIRALSLLLSAAIGTVWAADNELTQEEQGVGWELLFDGTTKGWKCDNEKAINPASQDEAGALVPYRAGGYLVVFYGDPEDARKPDTGVFGDFILKCDVKMVTPQCNSGIFIRTGDPKDPVQTGLEMQIANQTGTSSHVYAGIYDLAGPIKAAGVKPGEWAHVEVTCIGPHIAIAINGETITTMNCDEYAEPGKNPDGRRNKFKKAIKDFPRAGYIGFQDHADKTKAIYKNIKILQLDKSRKSE